MATVCPTPNPSTVTTTAVVTATSVCPEPPTITATERITSTVPATCTEQAPPSACPQPTETTEISTITVTVDSTCTSQSTVFVATTSLLTPTCSEATATTTTTTTTATETVAVTTTVSAAAEVSSCPVVLPPVITACPSPTAAPQASVRYMRKAQRIAVTHYPVPGSVCSCIYDGTVKKKPCFPQDKIAAKLKKNESGRVVINCKFGVDNSVTTLKVKY